LVEAKVSSLEVLAFILNEKFGLGVGNTAVDEREGKVGLELPKTKVFGAELVVEVNEEVLVIGF
jgi:hypothetical protein